MRIFAVLFFSALCIVANAQDTLSVRDIVPDKAIKISPLHLVNFYPTVEVSYEHRIAKRTSLQLEVGYVLDYETFDVDFRDKRGVKLKLEARNYFSVKSERYKLFYYAGEAYWNAVNFDRDASRVECFDDQCNSQFVRFAEYKMEYREGGFTGKIGYFKYIRKSDFFIDFNTGWTIRSILYREPSDFLFAEIEDDVNNFLDYPNETDRITVSPNFGFRLGYRLD
jgi:hypothetical protein